MTTATVANYFLSLSQLTTTITQTMGPDTGGSSARGSAAGTNTKSTVEPITSTTSAIVTTITSSISSSHSKRQPTIIIYPTVSPESIVIPIVSCIFGFPILALFVICCLRRRAKLARERERRRINEFQDAAGLSLVRFSPLHGLHDGAKRAVTLCAARSMSRGFPSLELDTVIEERSEMESTQITDLITPESPTTDANTKLNEIICGS